MNWTLSSGAKSRPGAHLSPRNSRGEPGHRYPDAPIAADSASSSSTDSATIRHARHPAENVPLQRQPLRATVQLFSGVTPSSGNNPLAYLDAGCQLKSK